MKARFTEAQPAVNWQPLDNGKVDVTICLNGQEVTEEVTQMVEKEQFETVTETYWVYDFNQFREKTDNISQEAVETQPEYFLDYVPEPPESLEDKLKRQEDTLQMLTECMLEVSEMIYA